MGWKYEFFRAFFVILGAVQTTLNAIYLTKKDGIKSARKQHTELPKNVTDKQMLIKVVCMFSLGIVFLTTGVISYLFKSVFEVNYIIVLIIFSVYAIGEAIYYKYWKTYGEAALALILLALFCFATNN
jgi:uncharacterized membrane-anchored protein